MRHRASAGMAIGLVALLFLPCWRPSKDASSAPVVRSSVKGPRRSPSELPESSIARFKKREAQAPLGARSLPPSLREALETGDCAFLSPIVQSIVSGWRGRPRYLQAYAARDSHSTPAPPSA